MKIKKHLERGVFLCLIFQSEKCFQNYGDDRPDGETDDANALEAKVHGE